MFNAKFAEFRQNIALFNGINTYETTPFLYFFVFLIVKSVFEVFIADPYVPLLS